jgi:hypothetical protein
MREAGDTQTGDLYGTTQQAQIADGVENGHLIPEFVEWLQGYPEGWTRLE